MGARAAVPERGRGAGTGTAAPTPPYVEAGQQRDAALLGMWVFLATEAMLFGGLFLAISTYRLVHPAAVHAAVSHLYMLIGGANTAVLMSSSLTMAIAVTAARRGARRAAIAGLGATVALGLAFLAVKTLEYVLDFREGLLPSGNPASPLSDAASRLFVNLYLVSTALHALHVLIGIVLLCGVLLALATRRIPPGRGIVVEIAGLYWHFVDIVWVFLFPALYLIGR